MQTFDWNKTERERYRRMFELLADHLDEKATRLVGAVMALSLGKGSHSAVRGITGLAMKYPIAAVNKTRKINPR